MSTAQLAAASFLARYSTRTHHLYSFQLREWFAWCERNELDPLVGVQRAHVELHILAGRKKPGTRRDREPVRARCQRGLDPSLAIELGEECVPAEVFDERFLPLRDCNAGVECMTAACVPHVEIDTTGRIKR